MRQIFVRFLNSASGSGILLLICVIVSIAIANSSFGHSFQDVLNSNIGFNSGSVHLQYTVGTWINDGLMAIFFLLVGLEIKRELIYGGLSTPRQAALPILCAIGGAILPAAIFLLLNQQMATAKGWGIPMATDIAFALAVLSMLSKRVPSSLKVFLAALAIVDDLIAILVIALFYSRGIDITYLGCAAGVFVLMLLANWLGARHLIFYILPGIILWYFIHHSGIHATIAGVLTAFAIPANEKQTGISPLVTLEHLLLKPVNFLIVPLFALANTNIKFESTMLTALTGSLSLGIIAGLIVGKFVGIVTMAKIANKLKIGSLPEGANWHHIFGVAILAGIGFTMSIFISLLSFDDLRLIAEAKFSILVASVIAGVVGYMALRRFGLKV